MWNSIFWVKIYIMSGKVKIKVRVAPSPTGMLHIGTAQSALYNWLFARKNGGEFHLRIEDTDKERSTKEYERSILDALEWLGLKWDGDVVRQSERGEKYKIAIEKLLAEGKAFYCYHTKEELELERKEQEEKKEAPIHICSHKNTEQGKQSGGIIRLSVGNETISFEDEIRGEIKFESSLLGDFSIAKSIDEPLYNLAVVIDDAEMEITHVIRGEDHISNTPKQILIYKALGLAVPKFAHLSLILGSDKSKLSKRHGDTAAIGYKKDYLPEAVINFLGTLSFSFTKEIMTKEEMVEEFELSKVHKSGAVFDIKKLNWLNSQYIKKLLPEEFKKALRQAQGEPYEIPDVAVPLITERLEKLSDVDKFSYLWKKPEYKSDLLNWSPTVEVSGIISSLKSTAVIVDKFGVKDKEKLRTELDKSAKENFQGNRGVVYWPFRVSETGQEKSPDPVEVASVLGKKETKERINEAIKKLE